MSKDKLEKTENARKFLNRYRMDIVDTNRRQQRCYIPPLTQSYKIDDEFLNYSIQYETETLYTIQIPESCLEDLVDFHNRVEESMRYTGSMDMFNHFLQKQEEEEKFREKHPAVQKAYEQYRILFKLAKSGEN